MKIAYLMESASTGRLSGELARREGVLREIASPRTEIDIFGLEPDPEKSHLGTVESSYDAALSTIGDLKCAMAAEEAGYQAVIIPCGGDPGIAPLREVLTIPARAMARPMRPAPITAIILVQSLDSISP